AAKPVPPSRIHPFANYPPKNNRSDNRGQAAPQIRQDGAYRNRAPIIGIDDTKRIFDFCLGTPVTLPLRDLIKVSPDLRQKLREAVTPKRVSNTALVEEANEEELDDENIQFYASMLEDWQYIPPDLDKAAMTSRDPVEAYLSRISPGEQPGILSVAQESHS
ncbi:hypothetical protein DXG01_016699, partial [Tephrocybe rancida]